MVKACVWSGISASVVLLGADIYTGMFMIPQFIIAGCNHFKGVYHLSIIYIPKNSNQTIYRETIL